MPPFVTSHRRTVFHRFCLGGTILALWVAGAVAAPSWGDRFALKQPDGIAVQVRIWGDEYYRVVESMDGYTLVRDDKTGEICYAERSQDGRELLSTGYRVDRMDGAALGLEPGLRILPEEAAARAAAGRAEAAEIERAELASKGNKSTPMPSTLGSVQGITLIIDFDDEVHTISASEVDNYLNQIGYTGYGNNGSVRDYYLDASNGMLDYTNHVPAYWYRANYPKSYYDDCDATYGTRAREMVREALIDLNNQGLDFSQYDANGDGYIDAINCFYAGYTDCGWSNGLWPHSGTGLNFSADGVSSYRYQVTGMGTSLTLSTFCHENGHMIGFWPDLYDYDGSSRGVGRFCVMCASTSSTNPQEPSAYMKYLAGWANIVDLNGFMPDIPVVAGSNTIYRYSEGYADYYLFENLRRTGRNVGLPDGGLAIWHCDPTGSNDDEQQTYSQHYEVTLVQADGQWDLENSRNYGDYNDLWGASAYTDFGPDTTPDAYWWNGAEIELDIQEISAPAETMTFTFNPGGGLNVPLEYATIQDAIDAAADHVEIVLADGVYSGPGNYDLDFEGKLITLRSESGDPTTCILDLAGAPGQERRALTLDQGEGPEFVIEGLTIRGGYVQDGGGAILLEGASPTIRNVVFEQNEAGKGGAIRCVAASPIVEGCTFHANAADTGQVIYLSGGSSPVASRVLITGSIGAGLPVEGQAPADSMFLDCSNLFGNANGDWVGMLLGKDAGDGNFSLDPVYCDAAAGDLSLYENSPCAPGWHPDGGSACGGLTIGACPVGCSVTLFQPVTSGPTAVGGDSRGIAAADYDNDGDVDLFVANHGSADVLLENQGDGTFVDVTAAPLGDVGAATDAAWADYDNDGDADLYVARLNEADLLYRNEGDGTFLQTDLPFMGDTGPCVDVSWTDLNADGLIDLYLVMAGAPNLTYTSIGDPGSGDWFFVPSTDGPLAVGGLSAGADWCDFDNDGDQDVLVVNYARNSFLVNYELLGFADEGGTEPLTSSAPGAGVDWGDFDNDGWIDLYIANDGLDDVLIRNDGGTFTEVADPALGDAGNGQGASWGDFDNDGLLDLYLARYGQEDRLFWNAGGGSFNPVSVPGGVGESRAAVWDDFDGDGDLDVYTGRNGDNVLLLNTYDAGHHWLHVELHGGPSNTSAYGARIRLTVGGKELVRDVQSSSGMLSQSSPRVEFGLGHTAAVDSMVIEWPSGAREVFPPMSIDRLLVVTEGVGASRAPETPQAAFALRGAAPNPFNPSTTIRYELPERSAVDLQVFDLRGRLVRSLRSGEVESAGRQQVVWNGRDGQGRQVASGTYFCRLSAGGREAVVRVVLVK